MANETNTKNIYLATSPVMPKIGERYICTRLEIEKGGFMLAECSTSKVEHFETIDTNLFKVDTLNSTYYVLVRAAVN